MRNPSPVRAVKKGSPAPSLKINTYHLFRGEDLEDLGKSHIIVENGVITEISNGWLSEPDIVTGYVLPLPVNAHIHLNDYRVPESCVGYSLSNYVGSKGLKHPLIQLFKEPLMPEDLLETLIQYKIIVDFQEHSWKCTDLREALKKYEIEYVGLSRPKQWVEPLEPIAEKCGGIGISNPTKVPSWKKAELSIISKKYPVAAHVSETKEMEENGGLHYLLNDKIRLWHIVHGIFLEDWELRLLADENIPIVTCPRSNLFFTGRILDLRKALKYNIDVALGTDNAGCFHPDVFAEAHLIYTLFKEIDPRIILKILFINGYKVINTKPALIKEGEPAYLMALDLGLANQRSFNPYASVISRGLWAREKIIVKKSDVFYIIKRL